MASCWLVVLLTCSCSCCSDRCHRYCCGCARSSLALLLVAEFVHQVLQRILCLRAGLQHTSQTQAMPVCKDACCCICAASFLCRLLRLAAKDEDRTKLVRTAAICMSNVWQMSNACLVARRAAMLSLSAACSERASSSHARPTAGCDIPHCCSAASIVRCHCLSAASSDSAWLCATPSAIIIIISSISQLQLAVLCRGPWPCLTKKPLCGWCSLAAHTRTCSENALYFAGTAITTGTTTHTRAARALAARSTSAW